MNTALFDSDVIALNSGSKTDDVLYDIKKNDITVTTTTTELLSSPNFLRIPLKPIEKPPTNEFINEKRWVSLQSLDLVWLVLGLHFYNHEMLMGNTFIARI